MAVAERILYLIWFVASTLTCCTPGACSHRFFLFWFDFDRVRFVCLLISLLLCSNCSSFVLAHLTLFSTPHVGIMPSFVYFFSWSIMKLFDNVSAPVYVTSYATWLIGVMHVNIVFVSCYNYYTCALNHI